MPAGGIGYPLGVHLRANDIKVFAREGQRGFKFGLAFGIKFGPEIRSVSADDDQWLACAVALPKQD